MVTLHDSLIMRNPVFLRYWIALTLSYIGDMASFIIFPLIALISLDSSVWQIGFLSILEPVTKLIFGPVIGSRIDRSLSPLILLRRSAIFRAIMVITIPLAAVFHHLCFLYLCLIAILVGFSGIYFSVASSVILPRICLTSELVTDNSYTMFSFSLANIIGLSCGGVLTQIFGAPLALILDTVTFCTATFLTFKITYRKSEVDIPPKQTVKNSVFSSLHSVCIHKIQRALIIETITAAFAGAAYYILLIILENRDLGINSGQFGIAMGIGSIGAVIGAVLTPMITQKFGIGPSLILGAISYSGVLLITAFIPNHHPLQAIFIIIFTEIFSGAGLIACETAVASIQQYITPLEQLGKIRGIWLASNYGGKTLAGLIVAGIGTLIGVRMTMSLCLMIGIIGGVFLFCTPLRTLRTLDEN